MKRIISLLLVVMMLASLAACAGTPDDNTDDNTADIVEVNSDESAVTTEDLWVSKPSASEYDGVFKAGYARVVINPKLPAYIGDNKMVKFMDDLYATCIAVHDGNNTALLYTVDAKNIGPKVYATLKLRISVATKVPKDNIIISATHSHSAFTPIDEPNKSTDESLIKWTSDLQTYMANIGKEAIADMEDAEIYAGIANTPNMAFVRRYRHADGTYSNKGTVAGLKSTTEIVAHAAEPDRDLQMIRFVRANKKDIVMTNWQGHLAAAIDMFPNAVTADLANYVRKTVEFGDEDILVAYFQGASGNLNLTTPIPALEKYNNYQAVGKALGKTVLENIAIENLTKLQAGEINGMGTNFEAKVRKHSEERIAQANEVMALETGSDAQKALMVKYNFNTLYAPKSIIHSVKDSEYQTFALSALSFGDLGFIGAPYEMFDVSGMQVKETSPYKMTFVLTCAGGYWGYVPSEEYYTTFRGYEYDTTEFAMGVAEDVVAEFIRMLKELRGIE